MCPTGDRMIVLQITVDERDFLLGCLDQIGVKGRVGARMLIRVAEMLECTDQVEEEAQCTDHE